MMCVTPGVELSCAHHPVLVETTYALAEEASSADDFAGARAIRAIPIGAKIAEAVSRPARSLAGWIAISAITVA